MKIYIASPYTIGDPVLNVRRSIAYAEHLVYKGHVPILPLLCHLWHIASPHPYDYWVWYSMQLLQMCDEVHRLQGESAGADAEVDWAREHGKPVEFIGDNW